MILVIRIKGMVKNRKVVDETLFRLRLRRKYSCTIVKDTKEIQGMLKKVKQMIAYGPASDKTLTELIETRGQPIDKKKQINAKEAAAGILKGDKFEDHNLKPFFRLHPPRKGINTKENFPKGALGNHGDKIDALIRRML